LADSDDDEVRSVSVAASEPLRMCAGHVANKGDNYILPDTEEDEIYIDMPSEQNGSGEIKKENCLNFLNILSFFTTVSEGI
jgi:hypothetical protein